MTSLTLDTIALCGFDYRFNSFYRDTEPPLRGRHDGRPRRHHGAIAGACRSRDLIRKDRERKLRADIRYMNETVDRIIRERRAERRRIRDGSRTS